MNDKSLIVRPAVPLHSPEGTVQGHARWMANPEVAGLNEPFEGTTQYEEQRLRPRLPFAAIIPLFGLFVC